MMHVQQAMLGLENQTFMMADHCNLSCSYCYFETGLSSYENAVIGVRDYERWFEKCVGSGVNLSSANFTGGEPLLNVELPSLLELFCHYFPRVGVFTNAVLVTDEMATELARLGVRADVSLDHVSMSITDRVRGGTKATLRGIDRLLEAGVSDIQLSVVLTSANFNDLESVHAFAVERRIGLELIAVGLPDNHPLSLMTLSAEERRGVGKWIGEHGGDLGRPAYYSRVRYYLATGRIAQQPNCQIAQDGVFISSAGEINLCGQRHEPLGNISQSSVCDVLKSKRDAELALRPGSCVAATCLVVAS